MSRGFTVAEDFASMMKAGVLMVMETAKIVEMVKMMITRDADEKSNWMSMEFGYSVLRKWLWLRCTETSRKEAAAICAFPINQHVS